MGAVTDLAVYRAAAEMISRAKLAAQLFTFGDKRNMNGVLGYADAITAEMYWARYRRGGIAGAIVDAYPDATWRGGAELIENESPDTITTFEKAWIKLE